MAHASWLHCTRPTCTSCSWTLLSMLPPSQQVRMPQQKEPNHQLHEAEIVQRWGMEFVSTKLTVLCAPCVPVAGAGGAAAPDLQKFCAELERLQLAAHEVENLATNSVRTGMCGGKVSEQRVLQCFRWSPAKQVISMLMLHTVPLSFLLLLQACILCKAAS